MSKGITDIPVVYLASPYSHPAADVRAARADEVLHVLATLIEVYNGQYSFFCPIVHSHAAQQVMTTGVGTGFDYWQYQDVPILNKCDEIWVVMMDGWEESKGVAAEIKHFESQNKRVKYIDTY